MPLHFIYDTGIRFPRLIYNDDFVFLERLGTDWAHAPLRLHVRPLSVPGAAMGADKAERSNRVALA